jgi:hypothetical protein
MISGGIIRVQRPPSAQSVAAIRRKGSGARGLLGAYEHRALETAKRWTSRIAPEIMES